MDVVLWRDSICLELQTINQFSLWLFQLDDSKSLHRKWLEITISIHFKNGCLGYQVEKLFGEKRPRLLRCVGPLSVRDSPKARAAKVHLFTAEPKMAIQAVTFLIVLVGSHWRSPGWWFLKYFLFSPLKLGKMKPF